MDRGRLRLAEKLLLVPLWLLSAVVIADWLASKALLYPYPESFTAIALCFAAVVVNGRRFLFSKPLVAIEMVCFIEVLFGASTHVFSISVFLWSFVGRSLADWREYREVSWVFPAAVTTMFVVAVLRRAEFGTTFVLLQAIYFASVLLVKYFGNVAEKISPYALFPYPFLILVIAPHVPFWGLGIQSGSNGYIEVGKFFFIGLLVSSAIFSYAWATRSSNNGSQIEPSAFFLSAQATIGLVSYTAFSNVASHVDFLIVPFALVTICRWYFPKSNERESHKPNRKLLSIVAVISIGLPFCILLWAFSVAGQRLDEWRHVQKNAKASYTPLSKVSPHLIRATLAMEDANFYSHSGVEPIAIHRALRVNLRARKLQQGGSTITQQLARMVLGENERSPLKLVRRKILELFVSIRLEQTLSKDQILEAYLNTSPWYGRDTTGIGEASTLYFHKSPSALNLEESLLLVCLPTKVPYSLKQVQACSKARRTAGVRLVAFYPADYSREEVEFAASSPLDKLLAFN